MTKFSLMFFNNNLLICGECEKAWYNMPIQMLYHNYYQNSQTIPIFFCNWSNQFQLLQLLFCFLLAVTDKSFTCIFIIEASYTMIPGFVKDGYFYNYNLILFGKFYFEKVKLSINLWLGVSNKKQKSSCNNWNWFDQLQKNMYMVWLFWW